MANRTKLKIMVMDDNADWANGLRAQFKEVHFDFRTRVISRQSHETTLASFKPDLVLFNCSGLAEASNDESINFALDIHRQKPTLPMLLVVDFKVKDFARRFEDMTSIDLVRAPVNLDEVAFRMHRLVHNFARHESVRQKQKHPVAQILETKTVESVPPSYSHNFFSHLALDIYSQDSGRLDARKISTLFGMKLVDLAHLLNQKLPTLSKTPDAPSIQSGLALLQKIGLALIRLVGSPQGIRLWMNAPNPQLEGKTPGDVLLNGQGDVILEMLEDMLTGQPA